MSRKISCTIIACNEADRIARCLQSVQSLVDEIVVVDSGSSDNTVEIAKRHGAKCFFKTWVGYGQQKRFAEEMATHDWILNIDADEWLTDELRREIASLPQTGDGEQIHGYRIDILNVYPGSDKPRLFADRHRYVRLYNKTRCRFPNSAVFDEVKVPRENRRDLRGFMLHRSIRSLSHLIDKNIRYFNLQAAEKRKSRFLFPLRVAFEPLAVFLKYYLIRRHFTGGCYGFLIASTLAFLRTYRLVVLTFSRTASS